MKPKKLTDWEVHFQSCEICGKVDIGKTASLANVCNRGAPMLRNQLSLMSSKNRPRTRAEPMPDFIEGRPVTKSKPVKFVVRERFTVTEVDKKTDKPVQVEKHKTISPVYPLHERAQEFLALAVKTMGGDKSRFFISQR